MKDKSRKDAGRNGDRWDAGRNGTNPEDVKRALKTERQLLADMTGDFWLDMIAKELKDIRMAYCQIGGNDGEQV